jgi:hypothetical protein
MTKRKAKRANCLHLLDNNQQQALDQFQKDFKTVLPHMQGMAQTAKELRDRMVKAPVWRIIENPKPDDQPVQEPEMWTVGHAKVNYVDNIKTEGTQNK